MIFPCPAADHYYAEMCVYYSIPAARMLPCCRPKYGALSPYDMTSQQASALCCCEVSEACVGSACLRQSGVVCSDGQSRVRATVHTLASSALIAAPSGIWSSSTATKLAFMLFSADFALTQKGHRDQLKSTTCMGRETRQSCQQALLVVCRYSN